MANGFDFGSYEGADSYDPGLSLDGQDLSFGDGSRNDSMGNPGSSSEARGGPAGSPLGDRGGEASVPGYENYGLNSWSGMGPNEASGRANYGWLGGKMGNQADKFMDNPMAYVASTLFDVAVPAAGLLNIGAKAGITPSSYELFSRALEGGESPSYPDDFSYDGNQFQDFGITPSTRNTEMAAEMVDKLTTPEDKFKKRQQKPKNSFTYAFMPNPGAFFDPTNIGPTQKFAGGGQVTGPGGGLDDAINTSIDGKTAAKLSDGEFVIPADVVSNLGDGSTRAGSEKLYEMIKMIRQEKTGSAEQPEKLRYGLSELMYGNM